MYAVKTKLIAGVSLVVCMALLAGCPEKREPLQVTYYYLPG